MYFSYYSSYHAYTDPSLATLSRPKTPMKQHDCGHCKENRQFDGESWLAENDSETDEVSLVTTHIT
jgi:hypothetical protein